MKRHILLIVAGAFIASSAFASGAKEKPAGTAVPQTLTVWQTLWANTAQLVTNLADTPLYKELEERTGVKVTWIHPPQGSVQARENFNLMVAANDLPDMIYWNWLLDYQGGPEKAILDKVIVPLNDLIAKDTPNFSMLLGQHPDWAKDAKTDKGTLYSFPFIRGSDKLLVYVGPILRKDWLDKLALQVPETMAEWEQVLTEFKKLTDIGPLTFTGIGKSNRDIKTGSPFVGAYGIAMGFYVENGKVRYGQYEPAYKEFLATFRRWYSEGLIDKEFITNDRKSFDSKNLTGRTGAFIGFSGSSIGAYLDAKKDDPTYDLVAAKYPVLQSGQTPFIGQRENPISGNGLAITTAAKEPDLAAKWADYAYGPEGHMLMNFGIEGESYTMVEDFPTYTDVIKKNSNGVAAALGIYTRAVYDGPMVQDDRYLVQYLARPQQVNAIAKWKETEATAHTLPAVTPTPEESQKLAAIMNEVNTYADEMFVKFILGEESIDNFDRYRQQLKRMGIEDAISIEQAALERYNKR